MTIEWHRLENSGKGSWTDVAEVGRGCLVRTGYLSATLSLCFVEGACLDDFDRGGRCRRAAQALIEVIGAEGPESLEQTVSRAVELIKKLKGVDNG